MKHRGIKKEWILDTVQNHSVRQNISDVEEHYFKQIEEAENRCLKVVFNPTNLKIVTIYFDRNMRKKGCK